MQHRPRARLLQRSKQQRCGFCSRLRQVQVRVGLVRDHGACVLRHALRHDRVAVQRDGDGDVRPNLGADELLHPRLLLLAGEDRQALLPLGLVEPVADVPGVRAAAPEARRRRRGKRPPEPHSRTGPKSGKKP